MKDIKAQDFRHQLKESISADLFVSEEDWQKYEIYGQIPNEPVREELEISETNPTGPLIAIRIISVI